MRHQHLTRKQRVSIRPRSRLVVGLLTGLTFGLMATPLLAAPYQFSYSGRLANNFGDAIKGPVDLEIRFYRNASGGTAIPVSPITKRGVGLVEGVFQVDLNELTAAETHLVFAPKLDTWVEVTDSTNKTTYPRQRLTAVPYAFKVPVDESAVTYDAEGRLTVNTIAMSQVSGLEAALTQKTDSSRPVYASGLQGKDVNPATPAAGQTLVYDGTRWTPQTIAAGAAGTVTSVTATAPLTVTAGTSTPALSMAQATSVSDGYLTMTDWLTFNGKQNSLGFSPLNKAGDTMTGALNMGGHGLNNLGAPSSASDAATKSYVDTADGSFLKKDGSTSLTGSWTVGQDLIGLGNVGIAPQKTLHLGTYTSSQESALTGALSGTVGGKTWFNSDDNQIKYWNGTAVQTLGTAGAGLSNLNGETGSTQSFAIPATSGNAPNWSSTSNVHTLNIPMASAGGVTAGLLSNSNYVAFSDKVSSVIAGTGISVTTGTTTPTVSLSGVGTAGTYTKVTTNAQGQVTNGITSLVASDIPDLPASKITTGQIPVALGGTGLSSGTAGGIPYFVTAGSMTSTGAGSVGQVLLSNGGSAPSFGTVNLASAVTGTLPLTSGGTGATSAVAARTSLQAAQSGINTDINALMSGNIGIGTTSTMGKLSVVGTGTPTIFVGSSVDSQIKMATGSYSGYLTLDTSGHLTVKSQSGQVAINTGGTDSFVVKPSGFVGIGTTMPSTLLHLSSTNANETSITLSNTSSGGHDWQIGSMGMSSGQTGNLSFYDALAATSRMVINQTGNVGIGTTNPTYRLHVVGDAGKTSGGTAWTSISDFRLKDIESDYEYGLEEIKKLHTIRFKYKKDNPLNLPYDDTHTGFIAQEVQKVIPDAVITRPDGYLELNVDPIHWATVNAVKQLSEQNEQLKDRAAKAEAETAQLKKAICGKFPDLDVCAK